MEVTYHFFVDPFKLSSPVNSIYIIVKIVVVVVFLNFECHNLQTEHGRHHHSYTIYQIAFSRRVAYPKIGVCFPPVSRKPKVVSPGLKKY